MKGLLCCFLTDRIEYKVMKSILNLEIDPNTEPETFTTTPGADLPITTWRLPSAPRLKFHSVLFSRVRGGNAGILTTVKELARGWRPREVIVLGSSIKREELDADGMALRLSIGWDVAVIQGVFQANNLMLDQAQLVRLEEALFDRGVRNVRRRLDLDMEEASAFTDRFFEQFFGAGRPIEAPGYGAMRAFSRIGHTVHVMIDQDGEEEEEEEEVWDEYDQDDEAFAIAQTLSFNHPQPVPLAEPRGQVPSLPKTWEEIIHAESDPADQVGDAICVICDGTKKATICLLPCSHLATCDACTREMFTRYTSGARKCPVCMGLVESVLRPYLSETKK